ncbi:hypothetical protein PSACC_03191 [Paramicrosporidium saccamoebae]|uniref:Uncharacterized protein n=1 Tax=Paramicrosporidium saccamoebae TaxID=1246581 RepID=A0A2H9TGV0_9FUNG|nr:hypothetical protein PSACC_03191 [Paramicrosporidium saccamoebae]
MAKLALLEVLLITLAVLCYSSRPVTRSLTHRSLATSESDTSGTSNRQSQAKGRLDPQDTSLTKPKEIVQKQKTVNPKKATEDTSTNPQKAARIKLLVIPKTGRRATKDTSTNSQIQRLVVPKTVSEHSSINSPSSKPGPQGNVRIQRLVVPKTASDDAADSFSSGPNPQEDTLMQKPVIPKTVFDGATDSLSTIIQDSYKSNGSTSSPLADALGLSSSGPVLSVPTVDPVLPHRPNLATRDNSTPILPLPRFILKGHALFPVVDIPNGKVILAGTYLVVLHSTNQLVAVLAISDMNVDVSNIIDEVERNGLIKAHERFPALGLSGMVIRIDTTLNVQNLPGPLVFTTNKTELSFEFSGNMRALGNLAVQDRKGKIRLKVKESQQPIPQAQSIGQQNNEKQTRESTPEQSLRMLRQQLSEILPRQPAPRLEPKEYFIQDFTGNFQNAFHSYKGRTRFESSEHLYGTLFSGEGYRILLASVGKDIAVLVMEDATTDAAVILDRVLTEGLQVAVRGVAGLSGVLIRERSPRVVEFVKGPLSMLIGVRALANGILPALQTLQEHQIIDSHGRFYLVLTRLNLYFHHISREPGVLEFNKLFLAMAKLALLNLLFISSAVVSCSKISAKKSLTFGNREYPPSNFPVRSRSHTLGTHNDKARVENKVPIQLDEIRVTRSSARGNTRYPPTRPLAKLDLDTLSTSNGKTQVEKKLFTQPTEKRVTRSSTRGDTRYSPKDPPAKSNLNTSGPRASKPHNEGESKKVKRGRNGFSTRRYPRKPLRRSNTLIEQPIPATVIQEMHGSGASISSPLSTVLGTLLDAPVVTATVVDPLVMHRFNYATISILEDNSVSTLPHPLYKFKGSTRLIVKDIHNGKIIFADNYMTVLYLSESQIVILVIPDTHVEVREIVNQVYQNGLIMVNDMFPQLGLSGMVIKVGAITCAQHVKGPLSFFVNQNELTSDFNWTVLNPEQVWAHDDADKIHINVQREHPPSPQTQSVGQQNNEEPIPSLPRQMVEPDQSLKLLEQRIARIIEKFKEQPSPFSEEPVPILEEPSPLLKQSAPCLAGNFQSAFHSYKVETQFKVSEHPYGTLFSGEEYRVLLASVGRDIAVLVMEEESIDAETTLERVFKDGLLAVNGDVAGLSGILIREQSPKGVEFVKGPLSVRVGGKNLTNVTLPEFQSFLVRRVSDSKGKFSLVLRRSYRYFQGPHATVV